ncbi:hypothetical protein ACUOCP_39680, partial [Escherichia sp. R-CC3]
NFRYGEDENNKQYQRNAEQSRAVLRESLLMAMCIRDMMQGNSKLADIGRVEESLGYNAIAAGFQGQRHWTDQYPNGDTAEAILNSSFDWNGVREPFVVATENGPNAAINEQLLTLTGLLHDDLLLIVRGN